ncbi:MAG: hypothetical protein M3Q03_09700 [Chloroflexota bacterium]|nr:hypothetical protein [Chloroflexota bacterium]
MQGIVHRVALAGVAALLLALLPEVMAAHELRDVANGTYALEVGFLNEPAYLGQQNGLFLAANRYGSGGGPVEGLAASLQAEVSKDGKTMPLALVPQPTPGTYQALFFPTAVGDYTFRIFGQIDGQAIDESFISSPTTFTPVEPISAVQFPVPLPSEDVPAQRIDAAEDDLATARMLGLGGLAAGVLGIGVGVAALVWSQRRAVAAPVVVATDAP